MQVWACLSKHEEPTVANPGTLMTPGFLVDEFRGARGHSVPSDQEVWKPAGMYRTSLRNVIIPLAFTTTANHAAVSPQPLRGLDRKSISLVLMRKHVYTHAKSGQQLLPAH